MASIRTRLTVTYAGALVGTMFAFTSALLFARKEAAYRELLRYVTDESGVATRLLRIARGPGGGLPLLAPKTDELIIPQVVERVRSLFDALPNIVILRDTAGALVYRSVDARILETSSQADIVGNLRAVTPRDAYILLEVKRDTVTPEYRDYIFKRRLPIEDHVLAIRIDVPGDLSPIESIIVGTSTKSSEQATRELFGALLAIAPIVLALSVGAAYYIAGSTLRPLEHVRTEVEAITDGRSLHRRLPVEESGDELARLAATQTR
jgi:hypothetical protein